MSEAPLSIPPALGWRGSTLQASQIREVAEQGMGLADVIPLWFGEGVWPASEIAVEAAVAALRSADHFYQPNSGKPALRGEIVRYLASVYDTKVAVPRITVTASGMQGVVLSAQAIVNPGDRVVVVEPAWPNIAQAFRIAGARTEAVALEVRDGRWSLDTGRLLEGLTPTTRALVLNSPNNPTGWTMDGATQRLVLEHCRRFGIWIVADDVYSRLYLQADHAPSFLSLAEAEDRVVSIHSFSKTWSMTGWRLGWLVAPACLEAALAMLTEFNIAGPPGFVQAAGRAVLAGGEPSVATQRQRLAEAFAVASTRLASMPRVQFIEPDGAFYCFFRVDGVEDSLGYAKRLLHEARVGLAPGIAFGPSGEGYLRLTYLKPPSDLEVAFDRLEAFLSAA